ncbi:MAG TPA: hypothetical protein VGM67_06015 [Gemmatimonadaceae bacterium]|jgi:hypothetical protein
MRFRALSTFIVAVAVTTFAAACGDTTTAPNAPVAPPAAASHSLLGTLLGAPKTIHPLLRTTPLSANVSKSVTVSLLGGAINIPSAGFSMIIPPLAVKPGTKITVTALAGSNVAYEMEPHGLKFLLPLLATQSLHGMQNPPGGLLGLQLGYFPDSTHVTTITELLNVNVDLLGLSATTTIWHFSGYIFAGGDDDSGF